MKTGKEFKYKDGTTEYYDPIEDFVEIDGDYVFYIGKYKWEIPVEEVESIRDYDLCDKCGHELYYDGCRKCIMEEELKQ